MILSAFDGHVSSRGSFTLVYHKLGEVVLAVTLVRYIQLSNMFPFWLLVLLLVEPSHQTS